MRAKRFIQLFLIGLVTLTAAAFINLETSKASQNFKEGDIIFQTSSSGQSQAIQLATHSEFSHVGLVFKQGKEWMVLEAVEPVQIVPIQQFIKRGDGGTYSLKRPKTPLTSAQVTRMKTLGKSWIKTHYDIYFNWSDEELYCSELVWKLYSRSAQIDLCPLRELKSFDLTNPIVQHQLKKRYGKNIPYHEKVVAPSDLFNSTLLTTIK